ncbi:hypothetical protein IPF86_02690 [Candidatus Nomurabacteria bacterium]|nr:MAG: hypothetical protein IPF86_02690 [Candidatus Nomurabacteria bacterium]
MAPSSTMTEKIMATFFLNDTQANDYFTKEIRHILSLPEDTEANQRFANLLSEYPSSQKIVLLWNTTHELSYQCNPPQYRTKKIFDMIISKVRSK